MSSISVLFCTVTLLVVFLIPASFESAANNWTGHFTLKGKLIERLYNSAGHLIDCNVYGDRKLSEDALKLIPRENQFLVNDENFQRLVQSCSHLDSELMSHSRKKRFVIFPNTKWCGTGDIASSFDDLGPNRELDMCCRTHDNCPLFINGGETKHGLTNYRPYPIFDCSCGRAFRDCLRSTKQVQADIIGHIVFGLLGADCLKMTYPEVCSGWWFSRTCRPDFSQPEKLTILTNYITY